METDNMKFVEFDKYCKTCEHSKKKEHEDPCFDCLAEPARVETHKPLKYEADEKLSKKEK